MVQDQRKWYAVANDLANNSKLIKANITTEPNEI